MSGFFDGGFMFYKILKDGNVIDVSDGLRFMRWQEKFKRMICCSMNEAQAIQSSDETMIWHEISMLPVPVPGYDTVEAVPIDEREYRSLRALSLSVPEDIIDAFLLALLHGDAIVADALDRLISAGKINEEDARLFRKRNDI